MKPQLTVIIINWNAQEYIVDCIRSVLNSDYPNLEVILIDNNSTDSSMWQIHHELKLHEINRFKVYINHENMGCPYAENQGIMLAQGKYMSIICGDTKVDKFYFSEIVKAFEQDCIIGAVGAKMYVWGKDNLLDSVGEYLTQWGILIQRHAGQELDEGQFSDENIEIFGIKGAGLTVRVDVLKQIGGFPRDYFMFLEETDVEWRIWLAGYKIVYVPKAIIYHATSTSINRHPEKDKLVKYNGTKNYIYTCLKNYGTMNLWRVMPLNILMWCGVAVNMAFQGRFKHARYVMLGVFWNVFHLKYIWKQRKKSRSIRALPDGLIMPRIMKRIKFRELMEKALYW